MTMFASIQPLARIALWIAVALSVPGAAALGQTWSDSGLVVTASGGVKSDLQVVADPVGGVYVAWLDPRPGLPSSLPQAYLTRIRSDGSLAAGWTANGTVASASSGGLFPLRLLSHGRDGVVLFWADEGEEQGEFFNRVFMHRFDESGMKHPSFPEGGLQLGPFDQRGLGDAIASDDGNYFVVGSWVGPAGSGSQGGILLTKVDSVGATAAGWPQAGVVLCDEPRTQSRSTLIPDGVGGVIVLWRDLRTGVDARLFGSRVSASGEIDPNWPVEGRDLSLLASSGKGFEAAADSAGFLVALEPRGLLAFDLDGNPRADWSPSAFTQDDFPNGPVDIFHRLIPSERGVYLIWQRRRAVLPSNPTISEDQRMVTLLTTQGRAATAWPDTGLVLNRSFGSDTLPPLLIRPAPAGLYLIIGAKDAAGHNFWRGGLLSTDLTWAPGWPEGGREVSRTIGGGPSTIASDGSLYLAFTFNDLFNSLQGIRLFKMGVDGPVATLASVATAEVVGDEARIEWLVVDPPASPLRVERSRDGIAWEDAGLAEAVGADRVRFVDRGLVSGERRAYRLAWSEAGQRRRSGVVWLERAASGGLRLASVRYVAGAERLEVRLHGASRLPIEATVHDLQGRVRARQALASSSSEERELSFETDAWAAGLYFVRIAQGGATLRSRVTVVR